MKKIGVTFLLWALIVCEPALCDKTTLQRPQIHPTGVAIAEAPPSNQCATVLEVRAPKVLEEDSQVEKISDSVVAQQVAKLSTEKTELRDAIIESCRAVLKRRYGEQSTIDLLTSNPTAVVFKITGVTRAKVVKIGVFDQWDEGRVRLLFERELVASTELRLRNPTGSDRVIQINRPFLVPFLSHAFPAHETDYQEEGDLQRAVTRLSPFERPFELLQIWKDIALGLKALHSVGIVYRDMKPANVFMFRDRNGQLRAKVGDLGGTFPIDEGEQNTEDFVGTVGYFPEELANPGFQPQPMQDVYGFLLTAIATLLHKTHDVSLSEFMDNARNRRRPKNHIHGFQLPFYGTVWTLDDVPYFLKRRAPRALTRLLERVPYRRYATMDAVIKALDQAHLELLLAGYQE